MTTTFALGQTVHTAEDHAAARQAIIDSAPTTLRIRCDQNSLFGCGRVNVATAVYRPIGVSAVSQSAFVNCPCCLPLSHYKTLYPKI
jgi:hypothetical protein